MREPKMMIHMTSAAPDDAFAASHLSGPAAGSRITR